MNDAEVICGDVLSVLPRLAEKSVTLTITSPPYYLHRDYGEPNQLGQEQTVNDYVRRIQQALVELRRVTADWGSCFLVIGDTYRGRGLLLVPQRVALAADAAGWTVRNVVVWQKTDPPPESPRDRWRASYDHVLFLTRRRKGYRFNAEALRVPYSAATVRRWGNGQVYGGTKSAERKNDRDSRMRHGRAFELNPNGCLPTDVWTLPTARSRARHYATFPEALVRRVIMACSEPDDLVLDPFAGSGTSLAMAVKLGRRCLGIELNPEYAELARAAIMAVTDGHTAAEDGMIR